MELFLAACKQNSIDSILSDIEGSPSEDKDIYEHLLKNLIGNDKFDQFQFILLTGEFSKIWCAQTDAVLYHYSNRTTNENYYYFPIDNTCPCLYENVDSLIGKVVSIFKI